MHSIDPIQASTQIQPQSSAPAEPALLHKPLSLRVIGLGGAGGNALAHMADSDLRELNLVALHTSARILQSTQVPEKILLGADLTHGLGAGGDPTLARAAAEHEVPLLKTLCQGLDLLFIVTGLGGGTGTGVAPVLARVARESGALVIAVATLPFDVEGPRRRRQANQGLEELRAAADAVICLPNQKIFHIVDEKTSVLESLKITNELLSQGIRGIWQMLTRPGLIHVDFSDLCAVLRDRHVESSFAKVEAQGESRARELIERLLAHPLMDAGQVLSEAEAVLVSLVGGPDLAMADVKRVMDEINRRTDNAQLIMGASIAGDYQGRLGLTLVVSRRSALEPEGDPLAPDRLAAAPSTPHSPPDQASDSRFQPSAPLDPGDAALSLSLPQLAFDPLDKAPSHPAAHSLRNGRSSRHRLQQAHLPLEIVSKGRFHKSHPTIHRGEDLDVPTYVRRGIPLN